MSKQQTDPFIVSDETCKGCLFYGQMTGLGSRTMCCDYTYLTGKFKPEGETCAECSVKNVRKRRHHEFSFHGEKYRERKAR